MGVNSTWEFKKLPPIEKDLFDNDNEILFYQTVNLIRTDPKWVLPHLKKFKDCKCYTGAKMDIVINRLK